MRLSTRKTEDVIDEFNTNAYKYGRLACRWMNFRLHPSAVSSVAAMEYTRLGKSGLRVSRICLGGTAYGHTRWNGWAVPDNDGLELIKYAYDAGINFFDTADTYSNGHGEVLLGKAIKKYNLPRDRIVITTKVGYPMLDGDTPMVSLGLDQQNPDFINRQGGSRKYILDACDASLRRLGLEYIDVYEVHLFDPHTPLEETMEALHDLVKMGKARYIGCSNVVAWKLQKANFIAEKNGWTKLICVQNMYNMLYREDEREVVPYMLDAGIGSTPWCPLSAGRLASKNRKTLRAEKDPIPDYVFHKDESDNKIIGRVAELAEKKNASMAQISLAWLLSKPYITAPVVGATKKEHIDDVVKAVQINLTDEECRYLEELYRPKPFIVFPFP